MTTEELKAFIQEDYTRFCSGEYDDDDDRIIEVLHELERREEVKNMTDEELTQIWEEALHSPIGEPIPEIVAKVVAELEDREAIE
jgi:hypothetical protein